MCVHSFKNTCTHVQHMWHVHVCMDACVTCMYVCMYVCTYVCIYVCMHARIHAFIHTYIHTFLHTCIQLSRSRISGSSQVFCWHWAVSEETPDAQAEVRRSGCALSERAAQLYIWRYFGERFSHALQMHRHHRLAGFPMPRPDSPNFQTVGIWDIDPELCSDYLGPRPIS